MKKLIVRILAVVAILIVLVVLAVHFFLDGAVKRGVETAGPMLTKSGVKLESVSLSVLGGSGKIKGLVVANPEPYKTPSAISVGTASLSLQPSSLLSDKIVIRSIQVQAPEITFETDLTSNNLSKLLETVEAATGGSDKVPAKSEGSKEETAKANKKLQVDEFVITGGKVNVSLTTFGGKSATVALPEIRLEKLGQGPDGITAAELTKVVLKAVRDRAAEVATTAVSDLKNAAENAAKGIVSGVATNPVGTIQDATKSIGNIFKKK